MQSAQTPKAVPVIELTEEFILETTDRLILWFRKDCESKKDLHDLSTYLSVTQSQLSGMWLLLVNFPQLTGFIDQKQKELESLFECASVRIKESSDLGRSPASSPLEVGQEGNQCQTCGGRGALPEAMFSFDPDQPDLVECPACVGTGRDSSQQWQGGNQ